MFVLQNTALETLKQIEHFRQREAALHLQEQIDDSQSSMHQSYT